MITNTELEHKGDQYPSRIISFEQDVDSIFFYTENNVILKITILRDSLIRFRYTTKGYFSKDEVFQLHGKPSSKNYAITTSLAMSF